MTYRRILIGTDLSEPAREAARFASRLGGPRTRFLVAHVAAAPPAAPSPPSWGSESLARRRDEALANVKAWCDDAGTPGAEPVVLIGSVPRELAREATRFEADLVVVGHRGRSPLERLLLGSTARSLLRATSIDTLVVRGPVPPPDQPALRSILVATDLQPPSIRAAERAMQLAKEHEATLTLVHVIDPSLWYEVWMEAPAQRDDAWVERTVAHKLAAFNRDHLQGRAAELVLHGKPAAEIARHARDRKIDLVAIGAHGAGLVERAVLGSTAEKIVEHAPCSVLLAR